MLFNSTPVKNLIQAVFPDWNKKQVTIQPVEKVSLGGMYWSGGYCNYYAVLELATMKGHVFPLDNPMRHITEHTQEMKPGFIVIQRTFSGVREYATIYCHPSNMPINITGPVEDLSQDEMAVLYYTRCRKPCYAGVTNYRYYEYVREGGKMTLTQWESVKSALMQKKLLMKNGALTIDGKNRVANFDYSYSTKTIVQRG